MYASISVKKTICIEGDVDVNTRISTQKMLHAEIFVTPEVLPQKTTPFSLQESMYQLAATLICINSYWMPEMTSDDDYDFLLCAIFQAKRISAVD